MKHSLMIFLLIFLILSSCAQDRKICRKAKQSFKMGQKNFYAGDYEEATKNYQMVLKTLQTEANQKDQVELRLDALICLIDIGFHKKVEYNDACHYLNLYLDSIDLYKGKEIFSSSSWLKYQRHESNYRALLIPQCKQYRARKYYQNSSNDSIKK